MSNQAFSKVGLETNKFHLGGFVRYPIRNNTTKDKKKPFVSFLITQYREAGKVGELKTFSKSFQVMVFDEKLVDMLRVIDQQIRVEVSGNIGISKGQNDKYPVPSFVATEVTITEHLGIPFQLKGQPEGAGHGKNYKPRTPLSELEQKLQEQEAQLKAKRANEATAPINLEEDEDLPF
jgi:hypothetical protein